jgi:hypothetical protein
LSMLCVLFVDGHSDLSASTSFCPFLNILICLYARHCGKHLYMYWAASCQWISAPVTPSDYTKHTTACCLSSVKPPVEQPSLCHAYWAQMDCNWITLIIWTQQIHFKSPL